MAEQPRSTPVVVGKFTNETASMMRLGSIVFNEAGMAFEVAKIDPSSVIGGLATVWGYRLPGNDFGRPDPASEM